jgi:hypothetical protein
MVRYCGGMCISKKAIHGTNCSTPVQLLYSTTLEYYTRDSTGSTVLRVLVPVDSTGCVSYQYHCTKFVSRFQVSRDVRIVVLEHSRTFLLLLELRHD